MENTKADSGQYLTFNLAGQRYGVKIFAVREINQMMEITPVPETPEFLKGVINLRGKVIPVVDLREKLRLEKKDPDRETCIVVLDSDSGEIGVVVDSVSEVVDLTDEQIERSPHLGDENQQSFILGMGKIDKEVIILIDLVDSLSKGNLHRFVESAA